jgi:hypothetical protein
MIEIIEIRHDTIDAFKKSWPCHGIDEAVDFIVVAFDTDTGGSDLVDYQCEDADHNEVEPGEDSGAALSALFEEIRQR